MKQKSEIKRTGPELLKRLLRQREMSVFLIILLVVADKNESHLFLSRSR